MAQIGFFPYNIFESGTVTITGEDSSYPKERLHDRAVSLYWKYTATGAIAITVDQGATGILDITFLAIEKHNFDGEDLAWQYSTDNFSADINDMVTGWTQSGNDQIIKTAAAQNKRYWRVTVTSLTDPIASELFMSKAYWFEAQAAPTPQLITERNVRYQRSMGYIERGVKQGPVRRRRNYNLFLDSSDLADFRTVLEYLDDLSKPFYFRDHDSNYFMARFDGMEITEDYDHNYGLTRIRLELVEVL